MTNPRLILIGFLYFVIFSGFFLLFATVLPHLDGFDSRKAAGFTQIKSLGLPGL